MSFAKVGDLKPKEIAAMKEQFGRIYKVPVCDETYLIRRLMKPDWDAVTKLKKDNPQATFAEIDEKIVSLGLIGPLPSIEAGGWATQPAGVVPTLSMVIRAKSGFVVPELADESPIVVVPLFDEEPPARPSEATIEALKASTRFRLRGLGIEDKYFVVRPITRVEWRQVLKSGDQSEQDVEVARKAVLWPVEVDWDEEGVGFCDTIAQFVLSISGYSAPSLVEEL